MRNDTLIKVTKIINDGLNELHFDYYNKEYMFVGTVIVNEEGKTAWYIFDKNHENKTYLLDFDIEENILETVSYILGEPVENDIEYVKKGKLLNPIRWSKAQEYIAKRGYVINYKQHQYYNDDIYDNGRYR